MKITFFGLSFLEFLFCFLGIVEKFAGKIYFEKSWKIFNNAQFMDIHRKQHNPRHFFHK